MRNLLGNLKKAFLFLSLFSLVQTFSFQLAPPVPVDVEIGGSLNSLSFASLAIDPQGNALVVWSSGVGGDVFARRVSPDGTLSSILNVSQEFSMNGRDPRVIIDKNGIATIVYWNSLDGINLIKLDPNNNFFGANPLGSGVIGLNSQFDFAVNDAGLAFVAYSTSFGTLQLFVFDTDGNLIGTPFTSAKPGCASANQLFFTRVSIAPMNNNQVMLMVYNEDPTGSTFDEDYSYLWDGVSGTLTPTASPCKASGQEGRFVSAAGASQNNAVALWVKKVLFNPLVIYGDFFNGTGWIGPTNLNPSFPSDDNGQLLDAGINASGFGVVAWTQTSGSPPDILNARTFSGSTFNDLTVLSTSFVNMFDNFNLPVSFDGKGYVPFTEADVTFESARAVMSRFDGSSWTKYPLASFTSLAGNADVNASGKVAFMVGRALNTDPQNLLIGLYVVFEGNLLAPSNLKACQRSNRFLSQIDNYNQLNWTNNNTEATIGYRVYRNGQLIATLSANTNCYADHCYCGCSNTYQVRAFDSSGNESSAATVRI